MIRITCLGAVGGVTGSNYLIETTLGAKLLVDCGLYQGGRDADRRNHAEWAFDPASVNTLVLTHAHIDHCGRIPKLVKDGFAGRILASPPTVELCQILLMDSAHIQEMNATWQTRRNRRKNKKEIQPLYTTPDAESSLKHFEAIERDDMVEVEPGVKLRFRNAGHILGSCIAELWIKDETDEVKVVFSGDLGKDDQLIVRDSHEVFEADYVFVESTYGDRMHRTFEDSRSELLECINYAVENGEKAMIPAFSVERTQELIYVLSDFHRKGMLPDVPVFLDSPLAIKATEIFRKNEKYFDEEAQGIISKGFDPLDFPNLKFTPSTQESMDVNKFKGPAIIMAGNGMCTAGRIKHHLKHNLWRAGASLIIVGFQARGTTGRRIVEGARTVKIFGQDVAVKAKVCTIGGFSAHGDQEDLLNWLAHFQESNPRVFMVHGESGAKQVLSQKVEEKFGFATHVPKLGEKLILKPREIAVEQEGEDVEEEITMARVHNVLVDMENMVKDIKGKLPERMKLPKQGDYDLERLQFVADELANILSQDQ